MSMSKDVSSAYREKKWGKNIEGEYVIDGYVFRGKLRFKKALNGLKGAMKKGILNMGVWNIEYLMQDQKVLE